MDRHVLVCSVPHDLQLARAVAAGLQGQAFAEPVWVRCWFRPLPPTKLRLLRASLSAGASTILTEPNAGGSSVNSEALSMEVLHSMLRAELLLTETEVEYEPGSAIADFVVTVRGRRVGVSVTRAMKYLGGSEAYTAEDANHLLVKKLSGMVRAGEGAVEEHAWSVALLHIFAASDGIADMLKRQLALLPSELWQRCIVLCTVAATELSFVVFKNVSDWADMPRADRARIRAEWDRQLQQRMGQPAASLVSGTAAGWALSGVEEEGGMVVAAERSAAAAEDLIQAQTGVVASPAAEDSNDAACQAATLLRESSAYTEVSEVSDR